MSSSDQDTKLAYWLPRLESYRSALDATQTVDVATPDAESPQVVAAEAGDHVEPQHASIIPMSVELVAVETLAAEPEEVAFPAVADTLSTSEDVASENITSENVVAELPPVEQLNEPKQLDEYSVALAAVTTSHDHGSEPRAVPESRATSESRATLPQVLHLPIDGILKRIKGLKPFVLGIGTVGNSETQWTREVVRDAVTRCCDKTGRNAILVSVRPSGHSNTSESDSSSECFREVSWSYFGVSKAETKAWHAQLADLPKWKKEFGLIVFDLGDVRFPIMPRIGRLCDGIVVQLLHAANSRDTIQALKTLQNDRLKILGVWSVELNSRGIAA